MSLHFSTTRLAHLANPTDDPTLSIHWNIGPRGPEAALEMRDTVTRKAEALLDASGLLIQWQGADSDEATVRTSFVVADYETARDVVWSALSEAECAHDCQILEGASQQPA